jgi:glutathione S-transferase
MIVLHHLNNSRSQRILWLLEELEVPYEIKVYERVNGLAPESLKQVHPLGKSPIVTDGDLTIVESAVIIEYLVSKYGEGKFIPQRDDEKKKLSYMYWMHYAEGSLMLPLVLKLVAVTTYQKSPFYFKPFAGAVMGKIEESFIDPNIKTHLDYVEVELGKSTWFAGDEFTAADIQMCFPLEAARTRTDMTERPNILAFVERCHQRPAYQRAIEKGPKYAYAD